MSIGILACSALTCYVDAAQKKMGTDYKIVEIDRNYHDRPKLLRSMVEEALLKFPEDTDTVLVAMGACGNCWDGISWKGTLVIPRMDDCITILLHKDDIWHANLKKVGHFYHIDEDNDHFRIVEIWRKTVEKYGERKAKKIFDRMYGNYTNVDIIDTGVFDCYDDAYVAKMKKDADLLDVPLNHVEGSNHIMEKLVSGKWDEQFIIVKPETKIEANDFVQIPSFA